MRYWISFWDKAKWIAVACLSAISVGRVSALEDPRDWDRWAERPTETVLNQFTQQMADAGLFASRHDPRTFLPAPEKQLRLNKIPVGSMAFGLHLTVDNASIDDVSLLPANLNLFSLTLVGFDRGEQSMLAVARQKELRSLSTMDCKIKDGDLQHLTELVQLETLNLKGASVSGPGFRHLLKLPALESLDVDMSPEQFRDLLSFELVHLLPYAHGPNRSTVRDDNSITDLELNGFYGFKVSDPMLEGIDRLQSIQRLDLIEAGITDQALLQILKLPQLQSLNLERTKITDETLRGLSASSKIQSLILDETVVTSEGMLHLLSFPQLAELHLNRCKLDDSALASLSQLKHLTKLEIGATSVQFEIDSSPDAFLCLRHLNLNGSRLTNKGLASVSTLPRLTWLDLTLCNVGEEGFAKLGTCQTLEFLYLNRSGVSDGALQNLSSLKNLRILSLNSTTISDGGLVHISKMTRLESLDLSGTHVSKAAVRQLQARLPNCLIVR